MSALSEPVFELNQESEHYKLLKEKKDFQPRVNEIFKEVANEYGYDTKDFAYYGCRGFGFYAETEAHEKFKNELTKRADTNNIHTFKLTSKTFKAISPRFEEIDKVLNKISPFALHDIFGMNNLLYSQWVGDRFFVQVKNATQTKGVMESENREKRYEIEPVQEIKYKDYLTLIMESLD